MEHKTNNKMEKQQNYPKFMKNKIGIENIIK